MVRSSLHKNPPDIGAAVLMPLIPWVAGGVLLYFYGGRLWEFLAAKLSGKSVEQIKADVSTVKSALKSPVATVKDFYSSATAEYISPAEQKAALAQIAAQKGYASAASSNVSQAASALISTSRSGVIVTPTTKKTYTIPYPNPSSQAEFRANIAAIQAQMPAK